MTMIEENVDGASIPPYLQRDDIIAHQDQGDWSVQQSNSYKLQKNLGPRLRVLLGLCQPFKHSRPDALLLASLHEALGLPLDNVG